MLVDNINILKMTYPKTWEKLKSLEKSMDIDLIQVEETRKGDKTLSIEKDGKKTYIHSKYNPIREAEAIIEEYEDIEDDTTIVFYGTGLGYHIDLFLEKHPNVNYYIYEPIPEMLYQYLSNKSIKDLPNKNLKNIVLGSKQETAKFLDDLIDKNRGNIILIELPIHKQIFDSQYNEFIDLFKTIIKNKRSGIGTNLAFQERWILNSMKNFGEVLKTPNILLEKKGEFKNKSAILVAAGPSLNEEIENLKYIKDNGLAYIFSVGSAVNTLVYHNIYPDAATTYDPGKFNQKVFTKIKEKGIKDIPMIFGSSVGYETLINYPGDKYHMITSQDTVSNYYLKNENNKPIDMVYDAPTIAVVTLQLLYELGFNKIILVGQNLAYKGKKQHSEGIHYSRDITDKEIENGIYVKDVYGEEILTNIGFNSMRQQMEYYIESFPDMMVINTTKGGARIEGTDFIELETVIDKHLKEKVYKENWLEGNKTNYDKEYLETQSKKMDIAYKRALKLIDEYYDTLKKIERLIGNRNFNQAEKAYVKLDNILRKVENNDFFKVFILPMNRVQYELLANSIDSLNEEKNPTEKGRKIVKNFKDFMNLCKENIDNLDEVYNEMKSSIEVFLENNIDNEG